ncbi:hypothetical protein BS17DRAFT_876995 [Gyrodon lividus]|nr:hypothetical protein BS17DRAFT_876995 [Gyrodon lividus]
MRLSWDQPRAPQNCQSGSVSVCSRLEGSPSSQMPTSTTGCHSECQESSKNIRECHSSLPYSWVAVWNNDIPPGSVPFSEEPNGQLFVARAIVMGETGLGSAGSMFPEGARISYRGRIKTVSSYDVLTCASNLKWDIAPSGPPFHRGTVIIAQQARPLGQAVENPTRSYPHIPATARTVVAPSSGSTSAPPQHGGTVTEKPPPALQLSKREDIQLVYMAQSQCVILVDDTRTMLPWWSQVRNALVGMVDLLATQSWVGVDVMFLHHEDTLQGVKTGSEFESIFSTVMPSKDGRNMAPKLNSVFENYLLLGGEGTPVPVVLLIFTDGVPADCGELLNKITSTCQRLDGRQAPNNLFRIHLLQVGDDRTAVRSLHAFDDQAAEVDRGRGILNTVSFHRARGLLNAENIMRILLAATEIPREQDPDLPPKPPAHVVEGRTIALEQLRALSTRT